MTKSPKDTPSLKIKSFKVSIIALGIITLLFSYYVYIYLIRAPVLIIFFVVLMLGFTLITSTIKNKKAIILLVLFFFLSNLFIFSYPSAIIQYGSFGTIPFLGLSDLDHIILIHIIWPILGSLLFMAFFPRIFTPLYLRYKRITSKSFKNVYLDISREKFSLKNFLIRLVYVYLFTFALARLLLNSVIDPLLFYPPPFLWPPEYISSYYYWATTETFFILLPISMVLWSIGWILEDAGLMHYRSPIKDSTELIVIEPIHYKYNTLLKGYAGFITLYYILDIFGVFRIYIYRTLWETIISGISNGFFQLMQTFLSTAVILPAYLLYYGLNKNFIRKGLKKDNEHFLIQELGEKEEIKNEKQISRQETRYFIISVSFIAFSFLVYIISRYLVDYF